MTDRAISGNARSGKRSHRICCASVSSAVCACPIARPGWPRATRCSPPGGGSSCWRRSLNTAGGRPLEALPIPSWRPSTSASAAGPVKPPAPAACPSPCWNMGRRGPRRGLSSSSTALSAEPAVSAWVLRQTGSAGIPGRNLPRRGYGQGSSGSGLAGKNWRRRLDNGPAGVAVWFDCWGRCPSPTVGHEIWFSCSTTCVESRGTSGAMPGSRPRSRRVPRWPSSGGAPTPVCWPDLHAGLRDLLVCGRLPARRTAQPGLLRGPGRPYGSARPGGRLRQRNRKRCSRVALDLEPYPGCRSCGLRA